MSKIYISKYIALFSESLTKSICFTAKHTSNIFNILMYIYTHKTSTTYNVRIMVCGRLGYGGGADDDGTPPTYTAAGIYSGWASNFKSVPTLVSLISNIKL